MKKRFVITNIPLKLPFQSTILYSFLLWHFEVNLIWVGAFATIYTIYWGVAITLKFTDKRIDIDEILKKAYEKERYNKPINK